MEIFGDWSHHGEGLGCVGQAPGSAVGHRGSVYMCMHTCACAWVCAASQLLPAMCLAGSCLCLPSLLHTACFRPAATNLLLSSIPEEEILHCSHLCMLTGPACHLVYHLAVTDLLKATPEEEILRRDIYERAPMFKWADGELGCCSCPSCLSAGCCLVGSCGCCRRHVRGAASAVPNAPLLPPPHALPSALPTAACYSLSPLPGRVVLLGDSAHAMQPNLGQGGCMAIEDAYQLVLDLCHVSGGLCGWMGSQAVRRSTCMLRIWGMWQAGSAGSAPGG